jgi:hypothetical protein
MNICRAANTWNSAISKRFLSQLKAFFLAPPIFKDTQRAFGSMVVA